MRSGAEIFVIPRTRAREDTEMIRNAEACFLPAEESENECGIATLPAVYSSLTIGIHGCEIKLFRNALLHGSCGPLANARRILPRPTSVAWFCTINP